MMLPSDCRGFAIVTRVSAMGHRVDELAHDPNGIGTPARAWFFCRWMTR